jgi:hypothetical protein
MDPLAQQILEAQILREKQLERLIAGDPALFSPEDIDDTNVLPDLLRGRIAGAAGLPADWWEAVKSMGGDPYEEPEYGTYDLGERMGADVDSPAFLAGQLTPGDLADAVPAVLGPMLASMLRGRELPSWARWMDEAPAHEIEIAKVAGNDPGHPHSEFNIRSIESERVPVAPGEGTPFDALHGTRRQWEGEHFLDPNKSEEYMLDRRLGTHATRDPKTGDVFAGYDLGDLAHNEMGWKEWGTMSSAGGYQMPLVLPDVSRFKPVKQTEYSKLFTAQKPQIAVPRNRLNRMIKTDQTAVGHFVMKEAVQRDPEILYRWLRMARGMGEKEARGITRKLLRGDTVRIHDFDYDLDYLIRDFNMMPHIEADKRRAVELARQSLRDEGYVGMEYINTAGVETAHADDPRAYIVIDPEENIKFKYIGD